MRTFLTLWLAFCFPALSDAQIWLDPSFGSGGIVDEDFSAQHDGAMDLLLQPDGKLVIAGYHTTSNGWDYMLARFNTDGSLDTGFGAGGFVIHDVGAFDFTKDAALQADGRIVVVGTTNYAAGRDKVILRFTANGLLDTGFGTNGEVIIDDSFDEDEANGVWVQADQKIVVVGQGFDGSKDTFYICRLYADGTFDTTFAGGAGELEHTITGDNCKANAVAIMPDGLILSVGSSYTDAATTYDLVVVRYLSDGTLDSTFDGDGRAIYSFNTGEDNGLALVVATDGSVLAGGSGLVSGLTKRISLVRFLDDGSVDTGFGTGGTVLLAEGPASTLCNELLLDGSGRILVNGTAVSSTAVLESHLYRLQPNGTMDVSWGIGGELVHSTFGSDEDMEGMVLQPDGKVVLAGGWINGSSYDTRLLRYLSVPLVGIDEVAGVELEVIHADATSVTFSLPGSGMFRYTVMNVIGAMVDQGSFTGTAQGTQRLDFAGVIAAGTYLISISSDQRTHIARFVVGR